MAVSGSQFTRIGASIHGVGKKLTITAKTEFTGVLKEKFVGLLINVGRLGKRP